MVKYRKSAARSGSKTRKARKASRGARKIRKHSVSRGAKRSKPRPSRPARPARVSKQSKRPVAPSEFKKAADEIPTLEQVTITCANCGRPFKVLKLKGLSLEGTICQRCSLGEMELPESFG